MKLTKNLRGMFNIVLVLLLTNFLSACMPKPPADDNTDATFIKESLPKLLGRKARNANEVRVLADVSANLGRESALRAMMEQPRFVDYWTRVIVDQIKLQRPDVLPLNIQPELKACFDRPMRVDASGQPISDGGALAEFIRDNPVGGLAPNYLNSPFNMNDVIRSAIELDDLSPIYRAYAFVFNSQSTAGFTEEQRVQILGGRFNEVFMNRNVECLACHNSEFSTTGEGSGWDRTHPVPLAVDRAVYGSAFGNVNENYGFLRGFSGGSAWGISSCGQINSSLSTDLATDFAGETGVRVSMSDIDAQFKSGYETTKLSGLSRITNPSPTPPSLPADQAYAFMIAANVVNRVWQEIMGEPLTISNYYARNNHQMHAQWVLTEFTFIPSSWSLKDLLVEIFETRFFNRKAPSQSAGCQPPRGSGNTPYCQQMMFEPWAERDPRIADADLDDPDDPKIYKNGQGDLVHRYSPNNLLSSLGVAMGWPEPNIFPNMGQYPDSTLVDAIGQYRTVTKQGNRGVDFQGLLTWEAEVGSCQTPAGIASDWIDELISAVNTYNSANPASPLTVEDVVETLKDRLIQVQGIEAGTPQTITAGVTERTALFDHFGQALNVSASSIGDLEQKLRSFCGVLIKTPDFMLANIKVNEPVSVPRLQVCNPGEPCSYTQHCAVYADTLTSLGDPLQCVDGSISRRDNLIDRREYFAELCPDNRCGFVRLPGVLVCAHNTEFCEPVFEEVPIPCDPTHCDPAPFDLDRDHVMLVDAAGSKVQLTNGVRIVSRENPKQVELREGQRVRPGDILLLPPQGDLALEGEKFFFATPRSGMASIKTLTNTKTSQKIFEIVDEGDTRSLARYIKSPNTSLNVRDEFGRTALIRAIEHRQSKVANMLIEAGANINIKDSRGARAIEMAYRVEDRGIVEHLSKRGAMLEEHRLELAYQKPAQKDWVMMVADPEGRDAKRTQPGEKMSTSSAVRLALKGEHKPQFIDIKRVQEEWQETGFHSRGQAGDIPNEKQRAQALEAYQKYGFEAEHKGPKD